MPSPIRVGMVGLSTQPFPQGWSSATHLPYLQSHPEKFTVTAVLNSSLSSSAKAIETFGLNETAKPFEDADSFLSSADIDIVAIYTEVKKHYCFAKAAIEYGKDVCCEWPLTRTAHEARELVQLAKKKRVKTYTCIECPTSPVVTALKGLVSCGRIGEVVHTKLEGVMQGTGLAWSEHAIFYLDGKSGQDPLFCRVSHPLEAFCRVLGEFGAFTSRLATHQKTVRVYDVPVAELGCVVRNPDARPYRIVERTAPDDIRLQGKLASGATAEIQFDTNLSGVDDDGCNLRWVILGTSGRIEVTQTAGPFLRDVSVQVRLIKGEKMEDVGLDWEDEGEFAMFGLNVVLATPARYWRAIAEVKQDGVATFRDGLRRLELLERILEGGTG